MTRRPRILIAPLNWGLGHATRCIPIIRHLIYIGCEVFIAGNGISGQVLKVEFPDLKYVELPDFSMKYSRSKGLVKWKILVQLVKLLTNVKKERTYLNKFLEKNQFDALISDNRFGFWHPSIPTVFITHQLRVISPFGSLSTNLLEKIQRNWFNRFTECWIPDFKKEPSLAGTLSHPSKLPEKKVRYLGPLSRFEPVRPEQLENAGRQTDIDCLISLSGPEPQRSVLEEILLKEARSMHQKIVLVRGLPGEYGKPKEIDSGKVEVYNYADAVLMNQLVNRAKLVVARSGYTTVMDLLKLGKKAIFIPTPGQTEQEYLAKHLSETNLACCFDQKDFSLREAIRKAGEFPFHFPYKPEDMENYKTAVEEFVRSLAYSR